MGIRDSVWRGEVGGTRQRNCSGVVKSSEILQLTKLHRKELMALLFNVMWAGCDHFLGLTGRSAPAHSENCWREVVE